jgi:hypothetical protein
MSSFDLNSIALAFSRATNDNSNEMRTIILIFRFLTNCASFACGFQPIELVFVQLHDDLAGWVFNLAALEPTINKKKNLRLSRRLTY